MRLRQRRNPMTDVQANEDGRDGKHFGTNSSHRFQSEAHALSAAGEINPYSCPACKSENTQRLSTAYMSGLSHFSALTGGFGWARAPIVGGVWTTGVSQTQLSQVVAPPARRKYARGFLLLFLGPSSAERHLPYWNTFTDHQQRTNCSPLQWSYCWRSERLHPCCEQWRRRTANHPASRNERAASPCRFASIHRSRLPARGIGDSCRPREKPVCRRPSRSGHLSFCGQCSPPSPSKGSSPSEPARTPGAVERDPGVRRRRFGKERCCNAAPNRPR